MGQAWRKETKLLPHHIREHKESFGEIKRKRLIHIVRIKLRIICKIKFGIIKEGTI